MKRGRLCVAMQDASVNTGKHDEDAVAYIANLFLGCSLGLLGRVVTRLNWLFLPQLSFLPTSL